MYVIDHSAPRSSDEDSDGNIRLSSFLARRIKSSRPPDIEDPKLTPKIDILCYNGPSSIRALTAHERTCLKAFFLNEDQQEYAHTFNLRLDDEDLDAQANDFEIPASCRVYRMAFFHTRHQGDPYSFKATSLIIQRADQTRSTSLVRFETSQKIHFGEVLLFFTVELLGEDALAQDWRHQGQIPNTIKETIRQKERGSSRDRLDNEVLLACVRHFPVCKDGSLLHREGNRVIRTIMGTDIHELIGLLKKGSREYIVRRYSALFP